MRRVITSRTRLAVAGLVLAVGVAAALLLVWPRSEPANAVAKGGRPSTDPLGSLVEVSPPRRVPALRFADGQGHEMTLDAFRGRAVALNLWATWCVPCRKEMPSLDRLQARLGGPGFLVLPLSIDHQGMTVVAPFYRELGLTAFGIYLDPTGTATSVLGVEGIPTTLLIGTDGREVGRVSGAAEWDSPEMIAGIRRTLRLPADVTGQPRRLVSKQTEGRN